jgi:hypothetical protein
MSLIHSYPEWVGTEKPDVAAAGGIVALEAETAMRGRGDWFCEAPGLAWRLGGTDVRGAVTMSADPFQPPGGLPTTPGVLDPVPVSPDVATPGTVDLYSTAVDLNQVLTPQEREAYKQHLLSPGMAPWAVVVLSAVTVGIFGSVYLQLKQSRLPVVKPDDPSATKAIGFMFIPFFNIYWYFVVWPRLVDRLNFQYRLRGSSSLIDRRQVTIAQILSLFGWILAGIAGVAGFIWLLVFAAKIQSVSNDLAEDKV